MVTLRTQCSFPGRDFDARVDFALLGMSPRGEHPDRAQRHLHLKLRRTAEPLAVRRLLRGLGGQITFAGWSAGGQFRLTAHARVKGIVTSYFWHNGGWSRLASGTSIGTVVLGLAAQLVLRD